MEQRKIDLSKLQPNNHTNMARLKKVLKEQKEQIAELNGQVDSLTDPEKREMLLHADKEIRILKEEIRELKAMIVNSADDAVKAQLKELVKTIKNQKSFIEESNKEISNLSILVDEKSKIIEDLNAEISELTKIPEENKDDAPANLNDIQTGAEPETVGEQQTSEEISSEDAASIKTDGDSTVNNGQHQS